MNKYIDAEKLKEQINEVRRDWLDDSTGLEVGESAAELGAAESILDSIDEIIESLQQEQPEVDLESPWKPEGQQLDCLRHMINVSTVNKIDKQIVQDLYEQLKKLGTEEVDLENKF